MTGMGGSEIAAVLGESVFASPFDVYLSKPPHCWRKEETEDMRRGSFLEPGIGAWYSDRFGVRLDKGVTVRHPKHSWALCTPDFIADGKLVSIKSPRRGGDNWGPNGSGIFPLEYRLQMQWEHAIWAPRSSDIDLAALVDGDLRVYTIQADAELQGWMLEYAGKWWQRHVVAQVPPPMDGSSQASAWLKKRFPVDLEPVRKASLREDVTMLELARAEASAERWEAEAETLRLRLKDSMGTVAGIESPAGRITWKADKNGKRTFKTKWTKGATP